MPLNRRIPSACKRSTSRDEHDQCGKRNEAEECAVDPDDDVELPPRALYHSQDKKADRYADKVYGEDVKDFEVGHGFEHRRDVFGVNVDDMPSESIMVLCRRKDRASQSERLAIC